MKELFKHNQIAYDKTKAIFETQNRTSIVHATGTGKSLIVAKFINDNPNSKFLFLAPNVFIFQEIQKHIYNDAVDISFRTYHYFNFNTLGEYNSFDYIFVDEFHRVGAKKWQKNIISLLNNNPNAKILGTTATHIRFLDKKRDMVKEIFDNSIASHLDLFSAINLKIHKKPIYISALFDIKESINQTKEKLINADNEKAIIQLESKRIFWEKSYGIDTIIKKHINNDRKKILVFCKDIKHLNTIHKLLIPIFKSINGNFKFINIHSGLNQKELKQSFNLFSNSNDRSILLAVDILNEGIHVSNVDTIMMFRNTISPIIYFQQIGRCFASGQKNNPLIFDFVNNLALKVNENDVLNTFKDDVFVSNPDNTRNTFNPANKHIIEFHDETTDFSEFLQYSFNNISTWDEKFPLLKAYFIENKAMPSLSDTRFIWLQYVKKLYRQNQLEDYKANLLLELDKDFFEYKQDRNVKTKKDHIDFVLNFFNIHKRMPLHKEFNKVANLRKWYKQNQLSQKDISQIKNLDPTYLNSYLTWDDNVKILSNYISKYKKIPPVDNMSFLRSIRNQFKQNKLSKKQIEILNNLSTEILNPTWVKPDWNLKADATKTFYKENNRLPTRTENPAISNWIIHQKKNYRGNKLTTEQIDFLNSIKPDFLERIKLSWEEQYTLLKQYYLTHNKFPLARENHWFYHQKTKYKNNQLSDEQILLFKNININIFN